MKSQGILTSVIIVSFFTADILIGADAAKKATPAAPAAAKSEKADKVAPKTEKPSEQPKEGVVAVVEGTDITKPELDRAFAAVMARQGQGAANMPPEQKSQLNRMVLDDLITDRLIAKRSADVKIADPDVDKTIDHFKQNFPSEEEFKAQLDKMGQTMDGLRENVRTNLRQQHWVEEQIKGKDAVTDAEAEEFYKKNPDKFKQPEQVRASHILLAVAQDAKPDAVEEKEKAAKTIIERVKKGEDFAKLAQEVSEDPSAKQNSGDLNFFSREQMVPEFADAAFKMKQDEVSAAPVRSEFGYHVIKVTGRKDAETVAFDAAKEKLVAFLKSQKQQKEIQTVVRAMREKAGVKINLPEPAAPPAAPDAPAATPAK